MNEDALSIITPERLRRALDLPGRSQTGLARRLGIDPSAVNRMVSGARQIKASELRGIHDYLAETAFEATGGRLEINSNVPEVRAALNNMRAAIVSASLSDTIEMAFGQVVSAIIQRMGQEASFDDDQQRAAFLEVLIKNPDFIYSMSQNSIIMPGVIGDKVRAILDLHKLAKGKTNEELEADPGAMKLVEDFVGAAHPADATMDVRRMLVLISSAGVALYLTEGPAAAQRVLRSTAEALERGMLGTD